MDLWQSQTPSTSANSLGFLPGGYEYATIGAGSLVDLCRVGGKLLRVGSVVPLHGSPMDVTRVRALAGSRFLELALWKKCEQPIAGPRAPYIADTVTGAYANGADATWTSRIVLPMAGRRSARFALNWDDASTVANFDYAVEATIATERGTTHVATLDGSTLLVTAGRLITATEPAAHVFTIGGWDSEENIHQLELFTRKPLAGTVLALTIDAECWGDLGCG